MTHVSMDPPKINTSEKQEKTQAILQAAKDLGFVRAVFLPVQALPEEKAHLEAWREARYYGEMTYLATGARDEPQRMLPHAKTMLLLALNYSKPSELVSLGRRRCTKDSRGSQDIPYQRLYDALCLPSCPKSTSSSTTKTGPAKGAYIAAYARGEDYHQIFYERLQSLAERCVAILGKDVSYRGVVDSIPLLEKAYGRYAGMGFVGKNTLLIFPGVGSFTLLGELLFDEALALDVPARPSSTKCGRCTACLDVCPTQAFVSPYVMDARRCISYLTIEYRGIIPREFRAAIGRHLFGCDLCQVVCPFNHGGQSLGNSEDHQKNHDRTILKAFLPLEKLNIETLPVASLLSWLRIGSSAYRKWVHGTALRRMSRKQFLRNLIVVLGNLKDAEAFNDFHRIINEDQEGFLAVHAVWAMAQLADNSKTLSALVALQKSHLSQDVQEEIVWALEELCRKKQ